MTGYGDRTEVGDFLDTFYQKAADRDCLRAACEFGVLVLDREGESRRRALKHLRMAADAGNVDAQYECGKYYSRRKGVASNSLQLARHDFEADAGQGHFESLQELTSILLEKHDFARAIELMQQAAERGSPTAMYKYATFLIKSGHSIEGIDFIKQSDLPNANHRLGQLHMKRGGPVYDFRRAFQFFLRAAEQGDVNAMFKVGRCYRIGSGVEMSLEKAAQWMRQPAIRVFSEMVRNGVGTTADA